MRFSLYISMLMSIFTVLSLSLPTAPAFGIQVRDVDNTAIEDAPADGEVAEGWKRDEDVAEGWKRSEDAPTDEEVAEGW
eukprot:c56230_g1_i1 orf=67-303(-)